MRRPRRLKDSSDMICLGPGTLGIHQLLKKSSLLLDLSVDNGIAAAKGSETFPRCQVYLFVLELIDSVPVGSFLSGLVRQLRLLPNEFDARCPKKVVIFC